MSNPNVLLVFPRFNPHSFWNLQAACDIAGARCPAPPLGLLTVAALRKIEKVSLTREQYIAHFEHEADEMGTKPDTSGVKSGATIYRLLGTGAVIR